MYSDMITNSFHAEPRTAEHLLDGRSDLDIFESDPPMQRGISESRVQKLSRVLAGDVIRKRESDQVVGSVGFDGQHASTSRCEGWIPSDDLVRSFEGLLQQNSFSESLDSAGRLAHSIGNFEERGHAGRTDRLSQITGEVASERGKNDDRSIRTSPYR
jgi:hypothetical protein